MLSGAYSVIGKAIAVYENPDDVGEGGDEESLLSGNTGRILGCCNILKAPNLDLLDDFLEKMKHS